MKHGSVHEGGRCAGAVAAVVVCAVAVLLGQDPLIAAAGRLSPVPAEYGPPKLTSVLQAVDAARRADRTVVVVGTSVATFVDPLVLAQASTVDAAGNVTVCGETFAGLLSIVQWLTQVSGVDVILIPLYWGEVPLDYIEDDRALDRLGLSWGFVTVRQVRRVCQESWAFFRPRTGEIELPPEERDEAIRRYYATIEALGRDYGYDRPDRLLVLQEAQRQAAEHGVRLLYYVTPHNPKCIRRASEAPFESYRTALRSVVWADFSTLLPGDLFGGDMVHFQPEGGRLLSEAIRDRLQAETIIDERQGGRTPVVQLAFKTGRRRMGDAATFYAEGVRAETSQWRRSVRLALWPERAKSRER